MVVASDSETPSLDFNALPPFHRVYNPKTEGNLQTQLGNYCIDNNRGGYSPLQDRVRLAFAVNELAATTLGLGKLYLVNCGPRKQQMLNSPHSIPDLLFVGSYKWTEEARDNFLRLKPAARLFQMTASLHNHHPAEPTLPVFIFQDYAVPYARPDVSLKLQSPPRPDKGVWIWTSEQPFKAGFVHDIAEMGIIHCPYDADGERLNCIIRRLDMACERHRAYLTSAAVGGDDQVVSVYQYLQTAAMFCSVLKMEMWGKIVGMANEAFAAANGGVARK
ncbi:uncharacterized protein LTHEOB_9627 [Lasiodiplodia theobromae]|uniref:uncharacterized protein n=1 Tax=Lasiodiplodia theobromae TaxID=45133 RepID=UPI0015C3258E|nr:uncharacterized protein LTHEOB_9627 [Lasiodiplodia theobromae]KAF4540153.1 hypothetical protein LTHEOB_9627 [Lasiodiplodia theobromae]